MQLRQLVGIGHRLQRFDIDADLVRRRDADQRHAAAPAQVEVRRRQRERRFAVSTGDPGVARAEQMAQRGVRGQVAPAVIGAPEARRALLLGGAGLIVERWRVQIDPPQTQLDALRRQLAARIEPLQVHLYSISAERWAISRWRQ